MFVPEVQACKINRMDFHAENGHVVWDCIYFGNYWQKEYTPWSGNILEDPADDGTDAFLLADKWIPVVFLTSVTNRQSIYSVLKSKPNGYILKPPDADRILRQLREF